MNIYAPYEELADTPDTLHLKLSDVRERMLFIKYRAVPIGIVLLVWLVLQQTASLIPMGFNYLLIIIGGAALLLLLFRSYISEIKIAAGNIFLVQKTFTGVRELNIPVTDAQQIVVDGNLGGGVKFILATKARRRFTLLDIPKAYADEKHNLLIEETLRQLLHVEVKRQ